MFNPVWHLPHPLYRIILQCCFYLHYTEPRCNNCIIFFYRGSYKYTCCSLSPFSYTCVLLCFVANKWTRGVPNSGFRTIRPNKNTNSVAGWAFWRCTWCSAIYHLLMSIANYSRACMLSSHEWPSPLHSSPIIRRSEREQLALTEWSRP